MSQYPPPDAPQHPTYGGYPQPQPPETPERALAHARRAGTMMIILGVLGVISGLCVAWRAGDFNVSDVGPAEVQQQVQQQIDAFESQTGMTFQRLMLVMAAIPLAVGALLGGLGFFVRGGSFTFIVVGIVVVAGLILVGGLMVLVGMIQGGAMGGAPVALVTACMYGLPLVLMVTLMFWLIQAARVASRVTAARRQFDAQVRMHQQYQQAYLQQPGSPASPSGGAAPGAAAGAAPPTLPQQSPPASGMGYYTAPQPPPTDVPADRKEPPDGPPPAG